MEDWSKLIAWEYDHRLDLYWNPSTEIVILAEDMPWELSFGIQLGHTCPDRLLPIVLNSVLP